MFLKLPDNQINTIKSARYPTVKGDQYTVTIKSSGTDNIIDLAITLDAEDTKKVFDNELSKYLKLKLFFVRDNVVLQELNKDFTSHLQIEQIIQKYKSI
jgi:hypothetical protein